MTQSGHSLIVLSIVAYRFKKPRSAVFLVLLTLAVGIQADDSVLEQWFANLSEEELQSIEPTLREQHFREGYPRLYRRHRVVKIDTQAFRIQLLNDWNARQEGASTDGLAIPLFEDRQVSVEIDKWIVNERGLTSGYGRPLGEGAIQESFVAHFFDDGRLDASIRIDDAVFSISYVRDYEHYLIMEMEPFMGAFD